MYSRIEIDRDIRKARTWPGWAYCDTATFERQKDRVFARSWQLAAHDSELPEQQWARPFTLLEGCLDEPLVLTRDEAGVARSLSNVCPHRANLVVSEGGRSRGLRCGYHGRRFDLSGRCSSMPELGSAEGFPYEDDHLVELPLGRWAGFLFTSLSESVGFDDWLRGVDERVGYLPLDRLRLDPKTSREYQFGANWALYCDNYLEGFHIPFVHPGLAKGLSYPDYRTELLPWGVLQVGIAEEGEPCFDLPEDHPYVGQSVAAFYFWLFPNTMLNFYPWGLSVNVVLPQAVDRTRVVFQSWVLDEARRNEGAGADLHSVELEDEAVVEQVQRGVRSRLYERGRYAPAREQGVHHFHRLLAEALNDDGQ